MDINDENLEFNNEPVENISDNTESEEIIEAEQTAGTRLRPQGERRSRPDGESRHSGDGQRRRRPQGERRPSSQGERKRRPNEDERRKSGTSSKGKGKKKKWSKKKKGILIAVVIIGFLLILLGIVIAVIFHYINLIDFKKDSDYEVYDSIPDDGNRVLLPDSPEDEKKALEDALRKNIEKNAKEIKSDDNVLNILLIGTDSRDPANDRGRSDSMILVSVNKKTKKVVMTSFLRDTWVEIPDIGPQRLNAAYAYGGPPLLVKTMEANFGIRIDKYATINFESFKDTIDTIGGVDIRVTDEEVPHINSGARNSEKLKQGGKYTLNGEQALAYARIRYIGTDFGRTQRQRIVMDEIFRKTKGMSLSELSDFLEKILPNVSTNFEKGELFWLLLKVPDYLSYPRTEQSIPNLGSFKNMVIDGMMVLGIDFEKYNAELKESIYG